jgi:hypothetical protein
MKTRFSLILVVFYTGLWAQPQFPNAVLYSNYTVNLNSDTGTVVFAYELIAKEGSCCADQNSYAFIVDGMPQESITISCDQLGVIIIPLEVTDCTGNSNVAEALIVVQDNLGLCFGCPGCCYPDIRSIPLVMSLGSDGTGEVLSFSFDLGTTNPCSSEPPSLSFSPIPGNVSLGITCNDLGFNPISLWATSPDTGDQAFAETFLLVQDNLQSCPGNADCLPVPVLYSGLTVGAKPNYEPTILHADDFDAGCYFPSCSGSNSYTLSFSPNPEDNEFVVDCTMAGEFLLLSIWMTDDTGNQNYAETNIVVSDFYGLCEPPVPPTSQNDLACDALSLDEYDQNCAIELWNYGATAEMSEPAPLGGDCTGQNSWCDGDGVDNSVWFTITAPATGNLTLITSGLNTQMALWEAASCDDLINGAPLLVAANDDNPDATDGSSILDNIECLIPGQVYYLQIDGAAGAEGPFTLEYFDPGVTCDGLLPDGPIECEMLSEVQSTGHGEWLHFFDSEGAILASLNDNRNDLGAVSLELLFNDGPVRTNENGYPYLDRNWTITPESEPSTAVFLRLYFEPSDFDALAAASPDIETLEDLDLSKISDVACGPFPPLPVANPLEAYNFEFDFSTNGSTTGLQYKLNSFSSFYLHSINFLSSTKEVQPSPWTLSPNPASTSVDILFQEDQLMPDRIRIFDSRGQVIFEQSHFQSNKNSISIKDFPVGIYFIIFDVENRSYSTKLIKQ